MPVDHSPHNKRGRRGEPSLWIYEPANGTVSLLENALRDDEFADEAVSLLENALREDEFADGPQSLLEENAQLRKLVVQLSNLLGDLPAMTTDETPSGRAEVSGGLDEVIINGAGFCP